MRSKIRTTRRSSKLATKKKRQGKKAFLKKKLTKKNSPRVYAKP